MPASRCPTLRPVKYSDFAAKVSGRSSISGRKIESTMDRWLEARMAPPSGGMYSRPVIRGRQRRRKSGPATTLDSWYCTRQLLECRSAWLLKDIRARPRRARSCLLPQRRRRPAPRVTRVRGSAGADILAGGPRGEAGRRGRRGALGRTRGLGRGPVVAAQHEDEPVAGPRNLLDRGARHLSLQQPGLDPVASVVLDHRFGDVRRGLLGHADHVEALLLQQAADRVLQAVLRRPVADR